MVNSYNIYDEEHYSTILYHAVAENEEDVATLAEDNGINLEGLTIELDKKNVVDELHRPLHKFIIDAQVH